MLIFIVILSGIISFLTSLWLIERTDRLGLVDIPNIRSSHNKPTPKGGGVGIVLGMLIALAGCYLAGKIKADIKYLIIIGGFLAVALVGFYNDCFNSSVLSRIILQTFIASIMVWFIGSPVVLEIGGSTFNVGYFGIIFAVIWLVGITNFYNFMDGINGLAAMQGVIAGIGIAVFGVILKDNSLIPIGLLLSGATAGFLMLNFPRTKIFMGDAGSYALGLYIASFALVNKRLLVPIALILGVFIFDTVVTLIRRIIKGECWYQAHRTHFYQRAVKLGYSHLQVTSVLSVVSFLLTVMACIYLQALPLVKISIIIVAVLGLFSLALWIILKEGKYNRNLYG